MCVKIGMFVATCALPIGAKHLAFVRGDLVPRADFAERAENVVVRLLDERLDDLFLAHRGDLFRIQRLRVEAAAGDDRHAGFHRRPGAGN